VVSAIQTAVRGRQRQYQIRDHLAASAKAEANSRELQEQLALALEASELGTFHCPMPLGRIEWNDQCKAHFGLPPESELDIDTFYSLLHLDDRERTRVAVNECVFGRKPYDIEYRVIHPDGQVRWIRATGKAFYDSEGNATRFDGTTEDITNRKLAEDTRERLLEAERLARAEAERVSQMKDEFLATLSHELRTPLNAIFGWAQILKMDDQSAETIKEGIDVIDRNVRLQTQLIEDLLDMSRIISGKIRLDIQRVDLPELINNAIEAVKPAAEAKSLRVERIVDPLAGPVSGDPSRLQQVLWNLLTNAIKFTPKGGIVQVLLERVNSHVEVSVVDSGEGIDPEFLPYLFERFSQADASTTRKHGGLGLGLSIVKNLVELHGGTIRAKSAGEGHGSTFVILLPLRVTKAAHDEVPHPRASKSAPAFDCRDKLSGLKVLVVDDEPDARALVNRFLIECGATAVLAVSAADAHTLLNTFTADVIISDIGMPDEDGYDFIRALRSNGNKTPAVALTAFARAEDRIRSIQAGFQTHLPKPVEPAELMAVVASLAGRF
jgi:PAS domain S-box-containing protein